MTEAQRRIAIQQSTSGINKLWNALIPLQHLGSFMNSGAHPDDERSHILAYLARNQGVRVMYATATRGKGGQNAIGTEAGNDLGAFRTEELEAAASQIPMSVHYYSEHFDDQIDDFGFSTDPLEVEKRWGRTRMRERLVRIIREQKPDILSPTFLDTDGQHGHHRAVTRATIDAYHLAADPDSFPEQISEDGLRPWQVKKLYLSAVSGSGDVYDDRDPPPVPTVSIPTGNYDQINGATYRQIGEWSRVRHLTQGMGRWRAAEPEMSHMHRLMCELDIPLQEDDVFTGLIKDYNDLALLCDGVLSKLLKEAGRTTRKIIVAFPDRTKILFQLNRLSKQLDDITEALEDQSELVLSNIEHRIKLKRKQLGVAFIEASGLQVNITWDSNFISPGQKLKGRISLYNTSNQEWSGLLLYLVGETVKTFKRVDLTEHKIRSGERKNIEISVTVSGQAEYHHPLDKNYEPMWQMERFSAVFSLPTLGQHATINLLPSNPVLIVPAVNLGWEASGLFYNRLTDGDPVQATLSVDKLTEISSDVKIGLEVPEGWTVIPPNYSIKAGKLAKSSNYPFTIAGPTNSERLEITPFANIGEDRFEENVLMMDYVHIRNTCKVIPATLAVQPIDLEIPARLNIGYVDRGADRVYYWLRQFGVSVTMLSVDDIKNNDLSIYDSIVIGIRAFDSDLNSTSQFLREYVEYGGNLVTQYNRTDDDWNSKTTPPRPITIGSPSFRWRITNPNAKVIHLKPNHHLLTTPNKIVMADWENWHQERGLYFPMEASPEYEFLLSISDHGKSPLNSALISASIGAGWHHHCSLILHHQLEHQVPGAARLLANLITPPDWK